MQETLLLQPTRLVDDLETTKMRPLLEYLPEVQVLLPKARLSSGASYIVAYVGAWTIELVPWASECGTRWSCSIHSSQIHRDGQGDTPTEALQDCLFSLDVAEEELKGQFVYLRGLPRKQ